MASKKLGKNETHFKYVSILSPLEPAILEDNFFGEFTFEKFYGVKIRKFGSNVFQKTADKINIFDCWDCYLENKQNYSLQTIFNRMTKLEQLKIGLNTNEVPSINPFGNETKLETITLTGHNLTIKSGTFHHLKNLKDIRIWYTLVNLENNAFKIDYNLKLNSNNSHSNNTNSTRKNPNLHIYFQHCQLKFQNESFDGLKNTSTKISFTDMNMNYLPEEAFKDFFSNKINSIYFSDGIPGSTLDCSNCKNYWLIKHNITDHQVKSARCINNMFKTLYDNETKTKLSQKCK